MLDVVRRAGAAIALALLLAAVVAAGLLPVSHAAPVLDSRPEAAALLLAFNPFVAVTSAAGFDLVRAESLYDALRLSGYRFRYPGRVAPPLLLAGLGLILGLVRPPRRPISRPGWTVHSSQEEFPA